MFTISLPDFPNPCSRKSLAEAVVERLSREQCLSMLTTGVSEHDLELLVRERLGYLADGY